MKDMKDMKHAQIPSAPGGKITTGTENKGVGLGGRGADIRASKPETGDKRYSGKKGGKK